MNIESNIFLISGGASGLGFATAQNIVSQGGKVILLDINEQAGQLAQVSLGDSALFCKTDIVDETQVSQAIEQALSHFGKIDGVINCAGIGLPKEWWAKMVHMI
jgi:NAD(P)-dependent dehydrogenase (short-subunit alcohol dehydrogenase family)